MPHVDLADIYHADMPPFLPPFLETPEMIRLRQVGMNCGCEYTAFPRFKGLPGYSRFDHSLGAALIVWHFTGSPAPTLAALFHDVAAPAFAHSIDFMRGDHLRQEATEEGTAAMIRGSGKIASLLRAIGLSAGDVEDYRLYSLADNAAPRLSADRLEYSMGNMLGYGFCEKALIGELYADILPAQGPDGTLELAFSEEEKALRFSCLALACARVYVSDEDRYAMQLLSELIGSAVGCGVLTEKDLYLTEHEVIGKLEAEPAFRDRWRRFRSLSRMVTGDDAPAAQRRVVRAKKRYIDPLVKGRGRLSELSVAYRAELAAFLNEPQDGWICAV